MRPPRIGGGNGPGAASALAALIRFNEAPANWRGKQACSLGLRLRFRASMRPPRIGGGNRIPAPLLGRVHSRFNEAPANWRGKRYEDWTGDPTIIALQ